MQVTELYQKDALFYCFHDVMLSLAHHSLKTNCQRDYLEIDHKKTVIHYELDEMRIRYLSKWCKDYRRITKFNSRYIFALNSIKKHINGIHKKTRRKISAAESKQQQQQPEEASTVVDHNQQVPQSLLLLRKPKYREISTEEAKRIKERARIEEAKRSEGFSQTGVPQQPQSDPKKQIELPQETGKQRLAHRLDSFDLTEPKNSRTDLGLPEARPKYRVVN
jgi:hypothetical protein